MVEIFNRHESHGREEIKELYRCQCWSTAKKRALDDGVLFYRCNRPVVNHEAYQIAAIKRTSEDKTKKKNSKSKK